VTRWERLRFRLWWRWFAWRERWWPGVLVCRLRGGHGPTTFYDQPWCLQCGVGVWDES
jgi:hypothetical protein